MSNNIVKSQKGDAIILLSVLVTGILLLVCAIAVDNLRKSASLQNTQKTSINELYKAEEGIEFSLYANKEKFFSSPSTSLRGFDISYWENNVKSVDSNVFTQLARSAQNRRIIISSESRPAQSYNNILKRTVFANLPSRYYDQVSLWDYKNGCTTTNCETSFGNNDMETGRTYQIAVSLSDFQKTGWDINNTQYRVVFGCRSLNCEISDLKIGLDCNFDQCPFSACGTLMDMNMWNKNPSMRGSVVLSEWFQYLNSGGTKLDLRNKKILVSFKLVDGELDEIMTGLSGSDIKMCKNSSDNIGWHSNNGSWEISGGAPWQPFTDRIGGLANFEFKKKNENIQYTCVDWEDIPVHYCERYENICIRPEEYCCGGYEKICSGYPANNAECATVPPGTGCNFVSSGGCGGGSFLGTCVQNCLQMCYCREWAYNQCINPYTVIENGQCIRYTRN